MNKIQSAINFIVFCRDNNILKDKGILNSDNQFLDLLKLANENGYSLSENDLLSAFKYDYIIRWNKYN